MSLEVVHAVPGSVPVTRRVTQLPSNVDSSEGLTVVRLFPVTLRFDPGAWTMTAEYDNGAGKVDGLQVTSATVSVRIPRVAHDSVGATRLSADRVLVVRGGAGSVHGASVLRPGTSTRGSASSNRSHCRYAASS